MDHVKITASSEHYDTIWQKIKDLPGRGDIEATLSIPTCTFEFDIQDRKDVTDSPVLQLIARVEWNPLD